MRLQRRLRFLRSRTFWAVAAGLGALVIVVVGLAAVELVRAEDELRTADAILDEVDALVEAGRLGEASARLDVAFAEIERANRRLYDNPAIDIIAVAPVASQNIASLRDSVGVVMTLTDGGRRILAAGAPLADEVGEFQVPLSDGVIPVDAVGDVRAQLSAVGASLPRLREMPEVSLLLGPVADLRERVLAESERRALQFDAVAAALQVTEELSGADGPRRFLVAVANTAEMRGTGGMVLSYGILDASGGDFTLGSFGRIDEIRLPGPLDPASVDLPADYLERWNGFDVTELWRNSTMGADLPLVAPTMIDMFEAATGLEAHGVIQIDPEGLAAILEGVGPVLVEELGAVTAENVVDLTLNRAYFEFPDIDTRSDVLGDVAEAAFDRLVNGNYPSLRPLAEALLDSSHGRHLAMYSVRPEVQAVLDRFHASNRLPPPDSEYLHLGVQNLSGNKLDYYVDSALRLTGSRSSDGLGDVTAQIELTNNAPVDATFPRYVFGPFDGTQQAGVYRGLVSLYLPLGASLDGVTGGSTVTPPTIVTEDGRAVVSFVIEVPATSVRTVELSLSFPPTDTDAYGLVLAAAPRVRPTTVSIDLDVDGRALRHEERLSEDVFVGVDGAAVPLAAG